jgi:hypothetical protein
MAAITTLRSTIATALANPGVWSVFSFPPPSVIANSVYLQPDDTYLDFSNNNYTTVGPTANLKVVMVVPMFDNQGNLGDLETFMVAVANKLSAANLNLRITSMSAPQVLGLEQGQMLSAELSISLITEWS